jgi:dTDP-4-amino-4,6-dideoxygalactose transaminase
MNTSRTIPFHRPYIGGRESSYVGRVLEGGDLGSDGAFTRRCAGLLEARFGIPRVFLTTSCTVALELAAMLCDLKPGDEVIMPSFTFVSTANAFLRMGARPVFVDIDRETLNLDESRIEDAVTPRTRAVVPVHYAGVGCRMDEILEIARRRRLTVIEDAAQGVDAYYRGRALGSIGGLGAFSFHETKNVVCGEGGALCVNDPELVERARILRDKGTNRAAFLRGEVDKYTWVDVGCSGSPSELTSAFLYAQLEQMDEIRSRRAEVRRRYDELLAPLERRGFLRRPRVPRECRGNNHLYYILLKDEATRDGVLARLRGRGVAACFHYVPLHDSPMGRRLGYRVGDLHETEDLAARLLRLPCYPGLDASDQEFIVDVVAQHFASPRRAAFRHVTTGPTARGLDAC